MTMNLNKKTVSQLRHLAESKGVLPTEGSGKGGRVLKRDIIDALCKSRGKNWQKIHIALSKKSPNPKLHIVRFVVHEYVYRSGNNDYIVMIGDIFQRRYRYGIAKLDPNETYATSVKETNQEVFEKEKTRPENVHYIA